MQLISDILHLKFLAFPPPYLVTYHCFNFPWGRHVSPTPPDTYVQLSLITLWKTSFLTQNILKRTRPGSEEEVQATQAYDALEKVRQPTILQPSRKGSGGTGWWYLQYESQCAPAATAANSILRCIRHSIPNQMKEVIVPLISVYTAVWDRWAEHPTLKSLDSSCVQASVIFMMLLCSSPVTPQDGYVGSLQAEVPLFHCVLSSQVLATSSGLWKIRADVYHSFYSGVSSKNCFQMTSNSTFVTWERCP